jgi:hypothetical protein
MRTKSARGGLAGNELLPTRSSASRAWFDVSPVIGVPIRVEWLL